MTISTIMGYIILDQLLVAIKSFWQEDAVLKKLIEELSKDPTTHPSSVGTMKN